jgi:hypothetical protein
LTVSRNISNSEKESAKTLFLCVFNVAPRTMTSTSTPPAGRLLRRLFLWEAETCVLLQKACDLVKTEAEENQEKTIGNNRVPVLPSTRWVEESSSSSEEEEKGEGGNDDSSGDDSESDDGEESSGSEVSAPANTPLETVQEEDGATTTEPMKSFTKPKPPSTKQQKRQAQLAKQHANNLQRMGLLLPPDAVEIQGETTTTDCPLLHICPPTCLLPTPKPTSRVEQAEFYVNASKNLHGHVVVVLLLQSGRFAGGVFSSDRCLAHRSLSQYTVRKGQGKAQSSQDGRRRPKSVGSQLRRAGEQALNEDVRETLHEWHDHLRDAAFIWTACPKTMRATLFDQHHHNKSIENDDHNNYSPTSPLLNKDDVRIRRIPFDVGRPTFESVKVVHEVVMGVDVRVVPEMVVRDNHHHDDDDAKEEEMAQVEEMLGIAKDKSILPPPAEEKPTIDLPLSPLHHACKDGNLPALLDILRDLEPACPDVDQPAGYDCMTPLHFAAASTDHDVDPLTAAACVSALLIQGRSTPTVVDARDRPPYFLATHDRVREAFRRARAVLGEDFCDWDDAKVGPALTDEDLAAKKEKEAEKKRRKKARQKEQKTKEKVQAQEMEERRRAEEEEKQRTEEAKRIRDGLAGKPTGPNVCDFCQKVVKGKKRNQMLQRLDYKYCSSDCVNAHKRELMAAAAMARFGG